MRFLVKPVPLDEVDCVQRFDKTQRPRLFLRHRLIPTGLPHSTRLSFTRGRSGRIKRLPAGVSVIVVTRISPASY